MTRTFLEDGVGELLSAAFREVEGDVYVVNPFDDHVADLVFRLHDLESPPTVRLLAAKDPIKNAVDDFIVAGHTADLVAAGTLSIRVLEPVPKASLIVSDSTVISLVEGEHRAGALTATEPSMVDEVRTRYDRLWAEHDEYGLRTPPLSQVRETLVSDIGPGIREDFDAILDSLSVAKGEGEGLGEVTITLLAAARNGELLYDLSMWGEDIGLSSKATFSRTKSILEDVGVIGTEKVPIDVGRPRLRLRLDGERLQEAPIPDLVADVEGRLAERAAR